MRTVAALWVSLALAGCGLVEEYDVSSAIPDEEAGLETQQPDSQAASDEPQHLEQAEIDGAAFDLASALDAALKERAEQEQAQREPTPSEQRIAAEHADAVAETPEPFAIEVEPEEDETPLAPTLDERIESEAEDLAVLLQERAAVSADQYPDLVKVAMLEGMALPGRLDELLADGASATNLLDSERRALEAWRSLLRRADEPDTQALASALRETADEIAGAEHLRITQTALCSRVMGFGRYEELATSNTFVAGHPHPMIVYVEIEGFAHVAGGNESRALNSEGDPPGWVVELSQELNLYHGSDTKPVWTRPPQGDLFRSRRRVHDFYLIQEVELPANLSVGGFKLKITVRDKASGDEDEAIIPIRVVADPWSRGG